MRGDADLRRVAPPLTPALSPQAGRGGESLRVNAGDEVGRMKGGGSIPRGRMDHDP